MEASGWRSVVGRVFPSVLPSVLPIEEKQLNLEELLDRLPLEAREAVEIGAVRAGLSENPDYASKARGFYADKRSGYDERARFEILCGNPEGAIAIYEEGHFFVDQAAKVAKEHISVERAIKVYDDALEKEDAARHHEGLARLYGEQGDSSNAEKHLRLAIVGYEKEGIVDRAVELERKHGTLDNVIEIYVRVATEGHNIADYFQQGAQVAEEAGDQEKAHQLYEKALDAFLEHHFFFNVKDLINLAQKVGDKDKLITVYEKASQPQQAYRLAMQEGYIDRAMKICLGIRVPEELAKMAKFALDNGHADMAIQIYEQAGLDKDAARTANQYGNPQKALEICEPKIDTPYENGYFGDADYYDIAMDAASKIGDEERSKVIGHKAMERFSVLGKFDISARFAEKLGYNEMASTYRLLASLPKT